MKKILSLLLVLSQVCYAGLPPTTLQGQSGSKATTFNFQVPYNQATSQGGVTSLIETGNKNLLVNASFENGTFSTAWTTSGGTATVDTTNIHDGKQSMLMTESSQTGLVSQDVTPTIQLGSTNVEYGAWVKTTLANVRVCARQGGSTVGLCQLVPNTGNWIYVNVNYPGPSSGSVGVSVEMIGSGTGTFNVDDAYVGPARNLFQVSQSYSFGSEGISACSGLWTATGSTAALPSTQTSCSYAVNGSVSAPSTNVPGVTLLNGGTGTYRVVYVGALTDSTATGQTASFYLCNASNASCASSGNPSAWNSVTATQAQIFDSVTASVPTAEWSWKQTSPFTSLELDIYTATSSVNNAQIAGTTASQGAFFVYYFPSSSQIVASYSSSDLIDWTSYTPTLGTGFGTATNIAAEYRRVGDSIQVNASWTNGTVAASVASISLPGSLTIDSTKLSLSNTTSNPGNAVGTWAHQNHVNEFGNLVTAPLTSTSLVYFGTSTTVNGMLVSQNGSAIMSSGDVVSVQFTVPILGWTSTSQNVPIVVGLTSTATFLTAGTTYTTPATTLATTQFKITLIGGGASGSGSPATASSPGAGGGGGGTGIVYLSGLSASTTYTVAIGSGGSGVSNAVGNAGGNTTMTVGATTYTASGGAVASGVGAVQAGGAGGTTTNVLIPMTGGEGGSSPQASAAAISGYGGDSQYGVGGAPPVAPASGSNPGNNATGFGAGGSGCRTSATSASVCTGGNGTGGAILVETLN